MTIKLIKRDQIAILKLEHEKKTNPFSRVMTRQLIEMSVELDRDDSVRGVLLTGGEGRSFSSGGDFRDISALKGDYQIQDYLLEIIDSYVALLGLNKPVVIGIDQYAIGQGLQVALMGDYRIATGRSQYAMPELKNGVACPLGSLILESFLGRAKMLRYVIDCRELDASKALELALIDEVVDEREFEERCLAQIQKLANYPSTPYQITKKIQNARLIQALNSIRPEAAYAHVESFKAKANQAHFEKIIGKDS